MKRQKRFRSASCAMAVGSMVTVGMGILLLLFLHTLRRAARIRKESEMLRDRAAAMESLNRTVQELAHHQRLETLGTLTAAIVHEFHNLLTPIQGYSLMALEKLPPGESGLYDDLLEIYHASRKAGDILSGLRDLSHKKAGTGLREVCPDELVQKTLDLAVPARPPRISVRLELNCQGQRIRANELQLFQLLLNLILNGFQAMGDGEGVLTVCTSFDEKKIRIRVADTGCGIPEQIRDRIFEPFFTTKEPGRGTGLGLTIAAQVVEAHRGTIHVDSRVGEGTAITVSLPRDAEPFGEKGNGNTGRP